MIAGVRAIESPFNSLIQLTKMFQFRYTMATSSICLQLDRLPCQLFQSSVVFLDASDEFIVGPFREHDLARLEC